MAWGWVREGSVSPSGHLCPPEGGGAGPDSRHARGRSRWILDTLLEEPTRFPGECDVVCGEGKESRLTPGLWAAGKGSGHLLRRGRPLEEQGIFPLGNPFCGGLEGDGI